jgi:chromosome segregation and condensation protein ScpB
MPDDVRTVDVHIPAALADRLGGPGPGLDRRALEALAIAAYQAGELTAFELRTILDIDTRYELDELLRARSVYEPVTADDIRQDLGDLRAFRG